jgi:hypothetical protein
MQNFKTTRMKEEHNTEGESLYVSEVDVRK